MRGSTSGVVVATVIDNNDTSGHGQIKVRFPWLSPDNERWISVASIMAGGGRGAFFMPEENDEVLVAFNQGNFDHAFIIGFTWNPQHPAPSSDPRQRMICSTNGHTIRFLDATPENGNQGGLVIEDSHRNSITLTNALMRINCVGNLEINGASVTIQGRKVTPALGNI